MVLIERKVVLMRFTIISRPDDHSKEVSDYLRRRCEETGWKFDESDFELVLSVGGDGTLLRSIHEHLDKLFQFHHLQVSSFLHRKSSLNNDTDPLQKDQNHR